MTDQDTTEGGLDVAGASSVLEKVVGELGNAGIRVSLFIDPDPVQVEAAHRIGAPVIELHTGDYHHAALSTTPVKIQAAWDAINKAATQAHELGLEVHAGHGLNFTNVSNIASIPAMRELNIGHFLIGEAIFSGLSPAIQQMRQLMDEARA